MPVHRAGDIVLRDYQIEAFIGEGGFGEVYRARQLHLNKLFALKILQRAKLSTAGYAAAEIRFRKEAQLGVTINQPAIVRVFSFSLDELSDQLVLVMAYAAGGSLRQALDERRERNQPYGVKDALRIARGIAAGLAALH
ncbi:MAG TPA: protein kinase, partial [Anaerolineaceae bacterium]|nr:protein kinase [Anaerolineaceae bacterium]